MIVCITGAQKSLLYLSQKQLRADCEMNNYSMGIVPFNMKLSVIYYCDRVELYFI